MSLTVHPDPQAPAGGFAFLELPEGTLAGDPVTVAVFDSYSERWLAPSPGEERQVKVGDPQWQSEKHEFGPYKTYHHDGADWVRVGPEIVNKIEEYAPVRIAVAGSEYDVSWPDDVPPRMGAATLGGLQPVRKDATPPPEPVRVRAPEPPVPEAEPEGDADPDEALTADTVVPERPVRRRAGLLLPLLLVLILSAGLAGAWWYWGLPAAPELASEAAPETAATSEPASEPSTEPAAESVRDCTPGALAGAADYARASESFGPCAAELSADGVLEVIESFAAQDDPDALYVFGQLYDRGAEDEMVETEIGLSLGANPARAVEYYARAAEAGSDQAGDRISAVCEELAGMSSTLARGAFDDYCG